MKRTFRWHGNEFKFNTYKTKKCICCGRINILLRKQEIRTNPEYGEFRCVSCHHHSNPYDYLKCPMMKVKRKMKKKYEFGIKRNKKLGFEAIVLADNTQIVIEKKQVSFMFPKKKFKKIFQVQIDDKTKSFIGISFNMDELNAIKKGLSELEGDKK